MTKIKICGLSRECDIDYANRILPEFIGFVFYKGSKRYVTPENAAELKSRLDYRIAAVGVFVDEDPETIAGLVKSETIDMIQLHGSEDSKYIARLRELTECPIIQAFRVESAEDISRAAVSEADFILLDSGAGSGKLFDHALIKDLSRPYFLAGGITPDNVKDVIKKFAPYAVDASSSMETDGFKDFDKMNALVNAARD
ncbi:MAG TPA: N-(5'-phosphoribosyl)anthranilate isomerase [Ruminococcus sp.]|nr:N-(5'-phosphoribosyl)anthranilate isomerase [Ruminococcus sp.]